MGKIFLQLLVLWFCLIPGVGQAQTVVLSGKTQSMVSGVVVRSQKLTVTDEKGGWYENGLVMTQQGSADGAYAIDAPLRVTSSSGKFQVRLDSPLLLQHSGKPSLVFRNVAVNMGLRGGAFKPLTVAKNTIFTNPAAPAGSGESVGDYLLNVTALPPQGDFRSVAGLYSGVLALTFEPVVQ